MEPIDINLYDYDLPEERIARYPANDRSSSKLLAYRDGKITDGVFRNIFDHIEPGSLLVFNNAKVIHARMEFRKATGARIEIFCLEPLNPSDYERAMSARGRCVWNCLVGNSRKWKEGPLAMTVTVDGEQVELRASRSDIPAKDNAIMFEWESDHTFGQLLEAAGKIPIPPYLCRDTEECDNTRYQTVYSKQEGSVAAPTAGLHFTDDMLRDIGRLGFDSAEVTLHVGAGTFLPVKERDAASHRMHTEVFEITASALNKIIASKNVVAVGTTTVRTLESLCAIGYRCLSSGDPGPETPVGQWEPYDIPAHLTGRDMLHGLLQWMAGQGMEKMTCRTRIMIVPGYRFRIVDQLITNFHQPRSTLLLLVSAVVDGKWTDIYDHAIAHGYRFLSYGDSSILNVQK